MSDDRALIARFLAALSAEEGASTNTVSAYRSDLHAASATLAGGLATADEAGLTRLGVSWGALAASSVARKAAALRRFFAFLTDEGVRADNPGHALPRPALRRALPRTLSVDEAQRLCAAAGARAESGRAGDVRLLALVELLYGSGLRATEVAALPAAAVRPGQPFLFVRGKGGKQRLAPLSSPAARAVAAWLDHRPAGSPWLFPSGRSHLSRVRLFQLLRALAPEAGLAPERLSPHVLRHAFATHLLAGGADLRALQTLLGHADIATTEIYTRVETSALVELVNARHPLVDPPATPA